MAVRYVAEQGWNVIAVARDIDGAYDLHAFANAADGRVRIVQADVRDATAIDRLAREVGETPIDLLVNNAGIPGGNEFGAISAGDLSEVFAVNTFAPVLVTQALRRRLVAGGKVVNITSSLGSLINAAESSTSLTYAMSKAALNMFSVKLAQALRPYGIAGLPCIRAAYAREWVATVRRLPPNCRRMQCYA